MGERSYTLPAIRVTAEERDAIRREADLRGLTVSEWVRRATTQKLARDLTPGLDREAVRKAVTSAENVPEALRHAGEQFDAGEITAESLSDETRRLTSGPSFRCPVCQRIYTRQIRCACSNRLTVPT